MTEGITSVAGIEIPSTDPNFLAVVGVHVLLGLASTVTGVIAMLSQKRAYYLVFGRGFRDGNRSFRGALDRGLSLVRSWRAVVCGSVFRPPSETATLAQLGKTAHHRHGDILRFASDRFLRGQRKAVARLERAPPLHLLAVTSCCRNSAHCSRAVVASAGTASELALVKRATTNCCIADVSKSASGPTTDLWNPIFSCIARPAVAPIY